MKVLIVDDDDDVRMIAKLSLGRLGGRDVVDARSGSEGVEKAALEQPDVILLDVMMPVMDGTATLAALRAQASTAAIPVVFLTAKAMTAEIERLKALGAVAVLSKPFNPKSLATDLRAALGMS
jgi:CheY-like chemotaxis protein